MFCSFIADKISSDSLGIICASFNQIGLETVSSTGETNIETAKASNSSAFHIVNQDYSSPLSFTFQVLNKDFTNITQVQERELNKCLCKRGKYVDFEIDDDRFLDLVLKVNISNPKIVRVGKVYGMEFTVTCKYPFAHTRLIKKTFNITTANQQIRLFINHDDDDYIYPDMSIVSNAIGTLSISNSNDVKVFSITNIANGEVISVIGSIPLINTSLSSHKVWDAFNKNWIRLVDGMNILTVSNPCTLTLSYQEARKVGV
jgi:hypothetical protein